MGWTWMQMQMHLKMNSRWAHTLQGECNKIFNDHWVKIISAALKEVQSTVLDLTRDSEQPSLPPEGPAIEAAWEVLRLEENDEPADIIKIIETCLKDIRRDKSKQAMKLLSHIITVTQYVKLCAHYKAHKACKQLCLKVSMAIACQMGKGPYFACQIQYIKL